MKIKKNSSFIIILIAAIVGLVIQEILSYFLTPKGLESEFVYPIPLLYLIFGGLSLAILLALAKVKENAPDSVGYAFLAFTTLKMAIAYTFLRPIIHTHLPKTPAEKIHFFAIFIYFLAIETYLTIRILNNKQ